MLSRGALVLIGGYQRWVSPRKGWSCAYRVAHGGTGCSGYAKSVIKAQGVRRALPLIAVRFADCRAAALMLQAARSGMRDATQDADAERRDRPHWSERCTYCNCADPRGLFCGRDGPADAGADCDLPCDGCHF